MSIKLMTAIWEDQELDTLHTLILLSMADHAQDDGSQCFPSMGRIAKKSRCSERQARRIVRSLESKGYLTTREQRGRNQCNDYHINVPPLKPDTMSYFPQEAKTGQMQHENRTSETLKSDTAMSAEPSLTVKINTICKEANSKPKKERPRDALLDSLASLGGSNPLETPRSRWSSIAKCKRDLLEVCPDLSPQEIDRRAENYRTHFSGAALTPEALTKHWAVCATRNTRPKQSLGLPNPLIPEIRFA